MDKLPPPTCDELRQAFEALAVRDHQLAAMGFAAAMEHRTWRHVIACKARADRKRRYQQTTTRRIQLVRRFNPATGQYRTQRVLGEFDDSQPLLS